MFKSQSSAGDKVKSTIPYFGFGGNIFTYFGRTTTVLGKFMDPENIGTGTQVLLQMPEGTFRRGESYPGGINILDLPTEEYNKLIADLGEAAGKEEFWRKHNEPFLRQAFERGDDIRLLSDPDNPLVCTGTCAREIATIRNSRIDADGKRVAGLAEEYGYTYNPATTTYEKKR